MRTPSRAALAACLMASLAWPLAANAAEGIVDYVLEWVPPQVYVCVFSGAVTCGGRPCPEARVELDILKDDGGQKTISITPGEGGTYRAEISMEGNPEGSARWVLAGRRLGAEDVHLAGRLILSPDQPVMLIEKSISL